MARSVRNRLSQSAAIGAMALLVIVGLAGLAQARGRSNDERSQTLIEAIDTVDRALALGTVDDPNQLTVDDDEFLVFLDGAGSVVAASDNVDGQDVAQFARDELEVLFLDDLDVSVEPYNDDNSDWEVAAAACFDSNDCAYMVFGRRTIGWWAYVSGRALPLLALLVGVGAITLLGARWLIGRALAPVDRMRKDLDTITASDLQRRIEVQASGDELEALGSTMNQTIERLATSLESQRQFVSDSAHELRSPLAGIRATLELAQTDQTRQQKAIDTSITHIDRTTDIVESLLILAKQDGGAGRPKRLTDIDDVVRTELQQLAERHPDLTIRRGPIEPVQSMADTTALHRLVRNLLDNARNHGDGIVQVTFSVGEGTWVLTVEDNGPGIPVDQRTVVFERFRRLDESRSRDSGGSGLGLAISAGIVAEHGGTIRIGESTLGGALFWVEVPIPAV